MSGRVGYANLTASISIFPFTDSSCRPEEPKASISDFLSMSLKSSIAADAARPKVAKWGAVNMIVEAAMMTEKRTLYQQTD